MPPSLTPPPPCLCVTDCEDIFEDSACLEGLDADEFGAMFCSGAGSRCVVRSNAGPAALERGRWVVRGAHTRGAACLFVQPKLRVHTKPMVLPLPFLVTTSDTLAGLQTARSTTVARPTAAT